jgi:hypothetical protein
MFRFLEKYPFFSSKGFLLGLFVLLPVAVTIQRFLPGPEAYNNYLIFRGSFFNLLDCKNLYLPYPERYNDLFKYSPTFAMLMGIFSGFPDWLGLLFWNLLNALVPFWAVNKLNTGKKEKAFILLFVAIEMLTSMQSSQSNGLMAGLIIGAFACMEDRKPVLAALLICLGFYIKVFAAAAGLIFLFYDRKIPFMLACAFWAVVLGVLPALACGFDGLILQYRNWFALLANDPAHELNFSIMTLTQRWFNFTASDLWYLVPGAILLLLPLFRKELYAQFNFRLAYLASILVWVVIFNHKAESPTYIIAMFGAAIWALTQPPSAWKKVLLLFVFVLTGLAATDIFPPFVRKEIIVPYCLKALPCITLWSVITIMLLRKKFEVAEPAV